MSVITTTNMSLTLPSVGTQPGPTYASNLNNSLSIIDAHDHTSGQGVQIPTAGLNLDADLTLNEFGLEEVQRLELFDNVSPISGATYPGTIYRAGDDLYFNDGAGNQIQLTISGAIAGTPGSIGSLASPAAVTYVSGSQKVVFESNSTNSTPASLDCGQILLREVTSGPPNAITLTSPTSLAAGYTLTLPPALGANPAGMLTINTSGVTGVLSSADAFAIPHVNSVGTALGFISGAGTANQVPVINSGATALAYTKITQANMGSVGQQVSSSSGSFTTTSTTFTDVTNLSVSLTTTGRPVMLLVIPDGTGSAAILRINSGGVATAVTAEFLLLRDSTTVGESGLFTEGNTATDAKITVPPGCLNTIDAPSAGTYTYKVQCRDATGSGTNTVFVNNCKLVAFEL